ncbi:unnamed protein product [Linum trigynum]|uniref:J domain-containing protein n=1 Tax=Linum trigynum TaxID=586398 RepID=A0AAV2DCU8_9ROSI
MAMIRCESSAQSGTHYEILSVKEGATYDELRSGYRSAILSSHPDKSQQNTPDYSATANRKFLRFQRAWEILSDSRSRAAYDKRAPGVETAAGRQRFGRHRFE